LLSGKASLIVQLSSFIPLKRRALMSGKKAEIRKNWVAPELKKIDIEEITAKTMAPVDAGGHTS
jgi:hypothetical protein